MLGQVPRAFASIALVATLLISGIGVMAPSTTARADDCLAAPNSPAPQGSYWYYRLDRATQRKCWYTRAPGQPAQQLAAPATTGPAASLHSTPALSGAPLPHVSAAPSPRVRISAVKPIPPPVRDGTADKTIQQSAQAENPASVAAPQASTLSETRAQAAAPPAATLPDDQVAVAPVKAQEAIAVPTGAHATSVSDDTEKTARRADPTDKPGMPIIIFPVLALGLVGVGIVIKIAAPRRARIIIDRPQPDTVDDQRQHEWRDEQYLDEFLVEGQELPSLVSVDDQWRDDQYPQESVVEGQELHSLVSAVSDPGVSAVSDPGPLRDDNDAFQIAQETSERTDRLEQLRRDIDRMLKQPTGAHNEPLRRRTAA